MSRAFLPANVFAAIAFSAFLLSSCVSVMSSKEMAGEYYALAEGYVETAKYDKAIPYYKKAAQRKEYKNAAEFGLARAYALSGNWDDSYALLARLHGIDPDNTLIGTAYAYALVNVNRIDEALSLYASLCAARSDDSVLSRNYSELLFVAGRYEETGYEIAWIKSQFPDSDGSKDIASLEKKLETALAPKPASTPKKLDIRGGPWDSGALALAAAVAASSADAKPVVSQRDDDKPSASPSDGQKPPAGGQGSEPPAGNAPASPPSTP